MIKDYDNVQIKYFEGDYNGKKALYVLSTSKTSYVTYAYALILLQEDLHVDHLILIQPFAKKLIKEYPKDGIRKKNGDIDKRSASNGTWEMLLNNATKYIQDYQHFINDQQEKSDLPQANFGDCLFCKYHNIPFIYDHSTYMCNGGNCKKI